MAPASKPARTSCRIASSSSAVGARRSPPITVSRTAPAPIEGTSEIAGRVASSASRYSAKVVQPHSSGPGPSAARR